MKKIIAIVGMAGSGKTEAANFFIQKGIPVLRFGKVTEEEIAHQGLPLNPENEQTVREGLRRDLGMAAFAIKMLPKIEESVKTHDIVVLDGLYSWEEYVYLKERFDTILLLAIAANPTLRHERLENRKIRPFSKKEAAKRDAHEIEKMHKAEPIEKADVTIENEGTKEEFNRKLEEFLTHI